MDWIRENKSLAAIVFAGLAGVLGLGFLLFQGFSAYSSSMDSHAMASANLVQLKRASLSPSDANLEAKQEAVQKYVDVAGKLESVLLALQQPEEPISDTAFQAKLKALVAETKEKAGSQGVGLPQDFAFGFEEYTASLPATASAASQLSTYLDAVNAITQLMLDSGVKAITTLERTPLKVEGGEKETPAPQPTRGRPPGPRGAMQAPTPPAVDAVERRTVELSAVMDQVPLQLLMNQLASPSGMPFFTVVRNLRVENVGQTGPLRSDVIIPASPEFGTDPSAEPAPEENPAVIKAAKPEAVDSVAVMGNEDLRVYMEIDLIRIIPKAENSAPSTPPAQGR